MGILSIRYPRNEIVYFPGDDLKGLHPDLPFQAKETLKFWSELNFRNSWLDLYVLARSVSRKHLEAEWTHILTFFAFRGEVPLPHLLLLHTIAVKAAEFRTPDLDPPAYEGYSLTDETAFDPKKVKEHFIKSAMEVEVYLDAHAGETTDLHFTFTGASGVLYTLHFTSQAEPSPDFEIENKWYFYYGL